MQDKINELSDRLDEINLILGKPVPVKGKDDNVPELNTVGDVVDYLEETIKGKLAGEDANRCISYFILIYS